MYEFLEGTVRARSATSVVINVGGVGYDLLVPLGSPFPPVGEETRVFTHLVVREDAHTLYGFRDRETREVFRLLLRVRGVGPTMAIAILSGMSIEDLQRALLDEDFKALTRVKGVGRKTAEQILLDLRDKVVPGTAQGGVLTPAPPPTAESGNILDAVTALASIGYPEKEARKLVEKAATKVDPSDLERLVRTAIQG